MKKLLKRSLGFAEKYFIDQIRAPSIMEVAVFRLTVCRRDLLSPTFSSFVYCVGYTLDVSGN